MQKRFVLIKKEDFNGYLYDRKNRSSKILSSEETMILEKIYRQETPYFFDCWCVKKEKFLLECINKGIITIEKGGFFLKNIELKAFFSPSCGEIMTSHGRL